MISILSPSKHLASVTGAPTTIRIISILMFHSFFSSLAKSKHVSLFAFFDFHSVVYGDGKIHKSASSLFLITSYGHVAGIRWSVYISKPQRISYVSFFRTDFGLCIYHLAVWSNFNCLHYSQSIPLPTQSCVVLYFLCTSLLYSLIMWLIISSVTTLPILLCIIHFRFYIICPDGIVLCHY